MGVDLTKTKFNPESEEHRKQLASEIADLEKYYSNAIKLDAIVYLPISASVVLWLAGSYGILMELLLAGGCVAAEWSLGAYKKHDESHHKFQAQLDRLVRIYSKIINDHGYAATDKSSVLQLAKSISQFVDSNVLWHVSACDPSVLSDEFKALLNTGIHRVPFNAPERQQEADDPSMVQRGISAVSKYVTDRLSSAAPGTEVKDSSNGSAAIVQDVTGLLYHRTGLSGIYNFFSRTSAEVVHARYGMPENNKTESESKCRRGASAS